MTVDLTGIAVAFIAAVMPAITAYFLYWLSQHMKDKQAADVIAVAVKNGVGALQIAATSEIQDMHPTVTIPGVPADLTPGVQYVLDQTADELARFPKITPVDIAKKLDAQLGLANIATNLAVTASPAPVVIAPLDPVPTSVPAPASPIVVVPGTAGLRTE